MQTILSMLSLKFCALSKCARDVLLNLEPALCCLLIIWGRIQCFFQILVEFLGSDHTLRKVEHEAPRQLSHLPTRQFLHPYALFDILILRKVVLRYEERRFFLIKDSLPIANSCMHKLNRVTEARATQISKWSVIQVLFLRHFRFSKRLLGFAKRLG